MKQFDTINVIPFVDILLVLLAMVLTTATFVNNGQLDITLPAATANPDQRPQDPVEIALDQHGQRYIDGEPVDETQLKDQLRSVELSTHFLLKIDESLEFSQFVKLIDLLKALKLEHVSIETRKVS